jgi:hypothetical protein
VTILIIGTNLNCAEETIGALIEDEQKSKLRRPDYRFKVGPYSC